MDPHPQVPPNFGNIPLHTYVCICIWILTRRYLEFLIWILTRRHLEFLIWILTRRYLEFLSVVCVTKRQAVRINQNRVYKALIADCPQVHIELYLSPPWPVDLPSNEAQDAWSAAGGVVMASGDARCAMRG